jgi:hypothetical protein
VLTVVATEKADPDLVGPAKKYFAKLDEEANKKAKQAEADQASKGLPPGPAPTTGMGPDVPTRVAAAILPGGGLGEALIGARMTTPAANPDAAQHRWVKLGGTRELEAFWLDPESRASKSEKRARFGKQAKEAVEKTHGFFVHTAFGGVPVVARDKGQGEYDFYILVIEPKLDARLTGRDILQVEPFPTRIMPQEVQVYLTPEGKGHLDGFTERYKPSEAGVRFAAVVSADSAIELFQITGKKQDAMLRLGYGLRGPEVLGLYRTIALPNK